MSLSRATSPRSSSGACGWRLQESDARDVTQDVLLKLQGLLAKFAYDPSRSFRGWLKTLTHHAWRDLVDDRRRMGFGSGDSRMLELFENIQAGDDLDKHLKQELHRELMEQAMGLVQSRVAARTWDAFRLTVLEECSGADAAARLEMTIARVYTSKSQVKEVDPRRGSEAGKDHMNGCPDRDLLERLLNDRLVDTELDGLEHHLQGCASCQQTLEELTDDAIWRSELRQEVSVLLDDAEPDVVVDPLGVTAGATAGAHRARASDRAHGARL